MHRVLDRWLKTRKDSLHTGRAELRKLNRGLPNLVEKSLAAFPMASGGAVNAGGND